jgi:hypothetical protein
LLGIKVIYSSMVWSLLGRSMVTRARRARWEHHMRVVNINTRVVHMVDVVLRTRSMHRAREKTAPSRNYLSAQVTILHSNTECLGWSHLWVL